MHATRMRWLSAAHSADWFQLSRHDDPEPTPADPPADPPTDPRADPPADPPADPDPADPDGAGNLGDPGKKALDAMKRERAEAKKVAAAEKKRADELAAKVQEFEDRDKSEIERVTAQAERANKVAEKATARAVTAELRARAGGFADAEDALVYLQPKLASYANADGDIDVEAIETDLADVLERKPHLRKAVVPSDPEPAPGGQRPKADPGQGPRPTPKPDNFAGADRTVLQAEAAKYGVRLR